MEEACHGIYNLPETQLVWTTRRVLGQVPRFSNMRSCAKNVGRPFLCYTETIQITLSLQGQHVTTSRRIFFFCPPCGKKMTLSWITSSFGCGEQPLFQECGRAGVFIMLRTDAKESPGEIKLCHPYFTSSCSWIAPADLHLILLVVVKTCTSRRWVGAWHSKFFPRHTELRLSLQSDPQVKHSVVTV